MFSVQRPPIKYEYSVEEFVLVLSRKIHEMNRAAQSCNLPDGVIACDANRCLGRACLS